MKFTDKQIAGVLLIAASIIPLFFTKDLGLTTLCASIGAYLLKPHKPAQDAGMNPDNL